MAGKLSSLKKYIEDDNEIEAAENEIEAAENDIEGLAALMISNSSESILGIIPGHEEHLPFNHRSCIGLDNDETDQHFFSQEKELIDRYNSQEQDLNINSNHKLSKQMKNEKYSPIFSSVNRKEVVNKIDCINLQNQQMQQQVNSFGALSIAPMQCNAAFSSLANAGDQIQQVVKQEPCQNNNPEPIVKNSERGEVTSNEKTNIIATHRSLISNKQQSFNSPRSLVDQIQLTSEKIQNSIDCSSVYKGKRKMIMLDEAGISKQSLNFGSVVKHNATDGLNASLGPSLYGLKNNTAPFRNSISRCSADP